MHFRTRTTHLKKLQECLCAEISSTETEEKCLQEYKTEMELLQQERMAHVEELRLIHADINLMEATIKQAEDERNKMLEHAKHLYEEQMMVKEQVDMMRTSIGLEPIPDKMSEGDEKLFYRLFEKQKMDYRPSLDLSEQIFPQNLSTATLASVPVIPVTRLLQPKPESRHSPGASTGPSNSTLASAAAFRQQPPPMKNCLSCHQQIHRNAPICPLCKAKSRSRNPKKPKRKLDD